MRSSSRRRNPSLTTRSMRAAWVGTVGTRARGPAALAFLLVMLVPGGGGGPPAVGGIIDLGAADEFVFGQPIVQVRITDGPKVFDLGFFNEFLLDTGASGILVASVAARELREQGFLTESTYWDLGIAGPQATRVSKPYGFDFAGSDGRPFTLPNVRIQTIEANFGFYMGIVGMPAMLGRTVSLDLAKAVDFENSLRMGVAFGDQPLPAGPRQYSMPLRMYEFPMTGQEQPSDPLPVYAPLPFAEVTLQHGGTVRGSSFLVDTGAMQTIFSSRTAFELGLDVNGNGDLWDEAFTFQEVTGVGGTTVIPILRVDALTIPTSEGVDLVFRDLAVGIIDVDDALDGVIGMNLLNGGWDLYAVNLFLGLPEPGLPGKFDRVDFDFRDAAATMAGEMRVTVGEPFHRFISQGPIEIDVPAGSLTQAAAGHTGIGGEGSLLKMGAGTLVLDTANLFTGPTRVVDGTLRVHDPRALLGSPTVVEAGATLAIAADLTMKAPSLTLAGGTLVADTLAVDGGDGIALLKIEAGSVTGGPKLVLGPGGTLVLPATEAFTLPVRSLSMGDPEYGQGRIDLGTGRIEIAAGGMEPEDLRAAVRAGRNGGGWDGPTGIGSSAVTAGFAVGSVVRPDGSAAVAWAALGDADLDGAITTADLNALLTSGLLNGSQTTATWQQGDFDDDGRVTTADVNTLLTGGLLNTGPYRIADPSPAAGVPEPGGMALAGAALALLAGRAVRRRLVGPS
jgi:autotransporter-associated beta strand protein